MEVLVQYHARPSGGDLRNLGQLTRSVIQETLHEAGAPEKSETSILYVDDNEMRGLNATYRGLDEPTDVLAFAMRDADIGDMPVSEGEGSDPGIGGEGLELLGDIIISLPTAARQADEREYSFRTETAVLLVHGVLHLLGHDHVVQSGRSGTREKAKAMIEVEKRCLDRLREKMII
ncbi:rRNA maturation RNase YbeY [bacterium]|nr:rRNA maturation RNase YbeY [bacterium]